VAQFLIEKGALDGEVHEARNRNFYEAYKAGTLDIHEFLDFQLKPLSRHPRKQLDEWHVEFMQEKIIPIITRKARDLVESHNEDARVIITATNSFVTWPIAREFGIENLIATEPEDVDGEFTGRVEGVPSFREGKVTRLMSWMAEHGISWDALEETWCYGDSLTICRCFRSSATRWRWIRTKPSRNTRLSTPGASSACGKRRRWEQRRRSSRCRAPRIRLLTVYRRRQRAREPGPG